MSYYFSEYNCMKLCNSVNLLLILNSHKGRTRVVTSQPRIPESHIHIRRFLTSQFMSSCNVQGQCRKKSVGESNGMEVGVVDGWMDAGDWSFPQSFPNFKCWHWT